MKVNKLLQFLTIVACIFIMTSCHTDVSQIDTKTKPTEFSTALVTIHSEAVPEATIPTEFYSPPRFLYRHLFLPRLH